VGLAQAASVLVDISSATLRKLVKLSERKEALLSQIQELDRQMEALQRSTETEAHRGRITLPERPIRVKRGKVRGSRFKA